MTGPMLGYVKQDKKGSFKYMYMQTMKAQISLHTICAGLIRAFNIRTHTESYHYKHILRDCYEVW